MKRILLSFVMVVGLNGVFTQGHTQPATKRDIQELKSDIKDDIKQLIHYMDKRFDDMNRRFDMLMWFIGILTVLSTATIGYIVNRLGKHEERFSDVDARLKHVDLSAFLKDLRSADPAIKKGLKEILK